MKSIEEVKQEVNRLVDYYTGSQFKECLPAERGYHLVRALDEMVYEQWFAPWKPKVDFECKGSNAMSITVEGWSPVKLSIHIRGEDDVSVNL